MHTAKSSNISCQRVLDSICLPTRMASNLTDATSQDFFYECINPDQATGCAASCVGLAACQDCQCVVESTLSGGGPWGQVMDVIFCLLPIVYLIVATVKPNPVPTTRSLPCAALIMFLVRTMYLGSDPLLTSASVISGFHEVATPLSSKSSTDYDTVFDSMTHRTNF